MVLKVASVWCKMSYNPNLPALLSLNKLPSLIYRRTICTLLWPVCFLISKTWQFKHPKEWAVIQDRNDQRRRKAHI